MFNWAIAEKDLALVNPAAKIQKPGETSSRSRYLKPAELMAFWGALTEKTLGRPGVAAFKILLLTAQREMEVLRMRWEDLTDEPDFLWTIPADHAKNELEHVVPLTPSVMWELGALRQKWKKSLPGALEANMNAQPTGYVFKSPTLPGEHVRRVFLEKRIIKLRKAAKIDDITIHDLRRTVTTYFGKLRVPQPIKKKILNHAKRRPSDVTDIYDRFEYIGEKRTALIKWEKLLLSMVGEDFDTDGFAEALFNDDPDNIIEMSRARA
jgi:integrase